MRYYVLSYDISCDKRRRALATWLLGFGQRVQESVFELALRHDGQLNELLAGVRARVDATDAVRWYWLPEISLRKVGSLGAQSFKTIPTFKVL